MLSRESFTIKVFKFPFRILRIKNVLIYFFPEERDLSEASKAKSFNLL